MGSIETFTVADARRYHEATFSIGLGAGRRFVRQVDLSGRKRIMDIGGGSGAYCIAAAKEHPTIRAVVLDLPVVCEVARDFIAANGVADRVEAQACNFTRDPFPADCDVAIMASNLPMYGREMIASVIKKAHDALLPGGQMHLIGEMTNDQRTGPWGPAYWGLGQAVSDSLGLAHSEADVIGLLPRRRLRRCRPARLHPGLARAASPAPRPADVFHTVICDLLGIKYPILQGAMQGGGGVELVAAVSEAGGLGVLPTFGGTDQKLRADIAGVRARTDKPFGVNIMPMGRGITERCAATCIELGIPIVTTGRADPGEAVVRRLKAAGIKVVSVIPTVEHARRMEAEGVDAVVASGAEAGGHVGTVSTLAAGAAGGRCGEDPGAGGGRHRRRARLPRRLCAGRGRHPDGHALHGDDGVRPQRLGPRRGCWRCARPTPSSPAP